LTSVPISETDPGDLDLAESDLGDEPLRWYVVAAFMVLVIAGFALAVWCTAAWYADCHDNAGTGRGASYAGDSMRGTLCRSGHGVAGALVPAGWLAGLALATLALARWGRGRLRTALLAALFLTPVVLPVVAYGGLGRSGADCTGEKLEAYRAWASDGSKGQAPYDCRRF
jgi:hypothetical protein